MADRKAVIKNADMSEDMQQDAIDCATQALEKYNIEKDIAAFIKKVSSLAGPKGLNFRDGSSPLNPSSPDACFCSDGTVGKRRQCPWMHRSACLVLRRILPSHRRFLP